MAYRLIYLRFLLCSLILTGVAHAQSVDVAAQIQVTRTIKQKANSTSSGVVVWLTPVHPQPSEAKPGHFRLVQKDKQFTPHLLVVPLGSSVDFPNLDPFFHNVFSLFNGKRFDLGLYEAGSTKTVHFDHEGVSYIFCNIHPEMGAVVVSLSTPYVAVSPENGSVVFHDVPADTYQMKVWAEGADAKQLDALSRRVRISPSQTDLGTIHVIEDQDTKSHKNKFGEDYKPSDSPTY